jgi:hypothetical protein
MSNAELDLILKRIESDLEEARKALRVSIVNRTKCQETLDRINDMAHDDRSDSETLIAKIKKVFAE